MDIFTVIVLLVVKRFCRSTTSAALEPLRLRDPDSKGKKDDGSPNDADDNDKDQSLGARAVRVAVVRSSVTATSS